MGIIAIVLQLVAVIISVALMTLAERKTMAAYQRRVGPNKVAADLQPIIDGLKLVIKETVVPLRSRSILFVMTPFLTFYLALLHWMVIPLGVGLSVSEALGSTLLVVLAISELSIYGVLLSGWSARSKYPLIGSFRSTAQMISYSCSIGLLLFVAAYVEGSIDLLGLLSSHDLHMSWTWTSPKLELLPVAILFAIATVAETNRAPFDLPEAESELVAGFFTEHSAVTFAYFFLGEFTNILAMATLFFLLFVHIDQAIKMVLVIYALIMALFLVRASFARFRYDGLLYLGWKVILPASFTLVLFYLLIAAIQ